MDLPSRVGRDIFVSNIFFFLVVKMAALKTQKFSQKSDVFRRNKIGKTILSYFIFSQMFLDFG